MTESSKNKFLMVASKSLSGIRYKLQHSDFLGYSYIFFLTGFFISPDNHLHRNFFYLFVLAPFILSIDFKVLLSYLRNSLIVALSIAFLSYFFLSIFWTKAALAVENYYDLTRYFLMVVIFIMATVSISNRSKNLFDKIIFWLCLVGLFASIIYGIIFYSSHSFPIYKVRGPFSYTGNANQAAMYFGFVGILAGQSYLHSKKCLMKVFYGFTTLTLILYLILSQSRGALFALVGSVIFGFIVRKRYKGLLIALSFSVIFIIAVEFVGIGIRSVFERGFSDRIDIWLATLTRISQVPFLGEGYFADYSIQTDKGIETSPHNLLLLVSLRCGLVGGALLTLIILIAFMRSYKYFKATGNEIYLCIFSYFTLSMTFDSTHLLYKPTLGWLIFWLPVGLLAGQEIAGKIPDIVTT